MKITEVSKRIGERLSAERKRVGLTQEELGKVGGAHRRTQVNYEAGARPMSVEYLLSLADAGIDVAAVLGIEQVTPAAETSECIEVSEDVPMLCFYSNGELYIDVGDGPIFLSAAGVEILRSFLAKIDTQARVRGEP